MSDTKQPQPLIPPLIVPPRTAARKLIDREGERKRLLFVMNPVAGRVTLKPYLQEVLRTFTLNGWLPTVYETESKGDGTDFVKAYAADYDLIVCAGGDGTLNETVTALLEARIDRPVGYIPCGSTNVFADSHGLSQNPIEAAEAIIGGVEQRVDVALFGDRVFCFVAAFGIFTGLSYKTSQTLKNIFGKGAYVLDALNDLMNAKRVHVRMTGTGWFPRSSGGEISFSKKKEGVLIDGDYILGALNNADSLASIIFLPPSLVSYDDGLFEVFLIRYPDVQLDSQHIVNAIRNDDYFLDPYFDIFRAGELSIAIDDASAWALDGEKGDEKNEIRFRVLPRAVRMILPAE